MKCERKVQAVCLGVDVYPVAMLGFNRAAGIKQVLAHLKTPS